MRLVTIIRFMLLFTQLLFAGYAIAESQFERVEIYRVETNKAFDDVVSDAEFAISEQNFALTGRSEIGKAISKRHE